MNLIVLIYEFTKPIIEVSGWLYQTKTDITHIVYQPLSRVTPPNYIALHLLKYSSTIDLMLFLKYLEC